MPFAVDPDRLRRCYRVVKELLLREQMPAGHWVGELSTSALSTATAVMALLQVRRAKLSPRVATLELSPHENHSPSDSRDELILRGVQWLIAHQNPDGGWGDTVKSFSNISTTMLCHAVLVAVGELHASPGVATPGHSEDDSQSSNCSEAISRAAAYIDRAGGVPALKARYGKDKTFSVPILTHCALAGLVDWREITPLPFELACIPARFYKTVRLPVVSYALPALIAIGQVRHHFAPTWNPITRVLRNLAKARSLDILARIQPPNGGFLEATPLTSFVTMSLAAMGLVDHPVVRKGVEFIVHSVRPDGSWPIDTNLSTWVTTLAVNALGDDLPEESRLPILNWLLDQQYKEVHPYTNADPGGWAWTNLPGGVPDADDTPGAMLAIMELTHQSRDRQGATGSASPNIDAEPRTASASNDSLEQPSTTEFRRIRSLPDGRGSDDATANPELKERVEAALTNGVRWLISLQNHDGGFPTFCRGWGTLPFDRSSPDISAHANRALILHYRSLCTRMGAPRVTPSILLGEFGAWGGNWITPAAIQHGLGFRVPKSIGRAFRFLKSAQNRDQSWHPLWFGNQHSNDINPTYGTAKVLAAYRDCGLLDSDQAQRGLNWLRTNQNPDGGWGAGVGTSSSVEETALAVEALQDDPLATNHVARGLGWLMEKVEAVGTIPTSSQAAAKQPDCLPPGASPRTIADPAPIGFYFAKLWYFERLYPLIFAVSCLRRAVLRLPAATSSPAQG